MDQIQTDSLEVEENFPSRGEFKGKIKNSERKKGKEEASFSGQVKEMQDKKWNEMNNLIKNLSDKLVKLELEKKTILDRYNNVPT